MIYGPVLPNKPLTRSKSHGSLSAGPYFFGRRPTQSDPVQIPPNGAPLIFGCKGKPRR